jgi:hypothetical protein
MNGDNLKKLYDNVSKEYELPDYATFQKDMQNEDNLKKFYSAVSADYELPEYEVFVVDMGLKKKEQTSQGSATPLSPSTKSGNEDKIKELTVKATQAQMSGDTATLNTIKAQLESLKKPQTKEVKPQVTEQDLRAVDNTMPTEQRPTPTLERQLSTEKVYRMTAPTANVEVPIAELEKKEKELRPTELGTTPEYEQVRTDLEDTYKRLERDYLAYLQTAKPDEFEQKANRLKEIEDKGEKSLGDQEFLRSLRADALEIRQASDRQAIDEIKSQVDLEAYNRKMTLLSMQAESIEKKSKQFINADGTVKSPAAQKEIDKLNAELERIGQTAQSIKDETGVDDDILNELSKRYNSLVQTDLSLELNRARFPELATAEDINVYEKALKNKAYQEGGFATKGALLIGDFMNTIGSGTVKMLEAPKVIADALGYGGEAGFTDVLYDLSTDLNKEREGAMSNIEGSGTLYSLGEIFAQGAGNVVQFATGGAIAKGIGGAANLTQKAAQIRNRAGVIGTAFLMSEGDNYREALAGGVNQQDAAIYATMVSMVQALTEGIVPDSEYLDAATRSSIIAAIKNGKGVKEAVGEYLGQVALTGAKEGGEEFVTEIAGDTTKEVINFATENEIYKDTFNGENYLKAIGAGFVTGGGLKALSRSRKKSPIEKETQRYIAENAPTITADIAEISPETIGEVAGEVERLTKISSGLSKIPAYEGLGAKEKDEVLDLLVQKDELKKAASEAGIKDEATSEQIEVIDAQVNGLFAGFKISEQVEIETEEGQPNKIVTIGGDVVEQSPTSEVAETVTPVVEGTKESPVFLDKNVTNDTLNTPSEVQADVVTTSTPTEVVGQEFSPSVQVDVQGNVQNVQPNVQDALKDAESTAKALGEMNYDTYLDYETYEDVKRLPLIYRGASKGGEELGFYSFDKTEAERYAKGTPNSLVRSAMINPNAKILNMIDAEGNLIPEAVEEYERVTGEKFDDDGLGVTETMWGDTKEKRYLIKAGYDGINSYSMDGNVFVAFNSKATIEATPKSISEAYHSAKADGSNPELIQAVESLLSQPTTLQEGVESQGVETKKINEKAERAKKKVNDIAEKLKEKLKAKGIEDLNIKKMGVGSDEIIDGLAKMVNALIDLGYSASDAIAEVLDSAKEVLGSEELSEVESALKANMLSGVDTDKAASELGVPKDVFEDEAMRSLTINPNEAAKNGEKVIDDLNNADVRVQRVKSLIRALKSAEGLDQVTKDKLNSELGEFYNVLTDKELEAIGEAIIEEYGGLDAVIKDLKNNEIPPFIKVFALGQGIVQARKAEVEAKTDKERDEQSERQVELSDTLDELVRDYGRAISYLRVLYYMSPLAVVKKLKKEIEAQNKIYGEGAKEKAQGILDLLDNAETTIEAFDDLIENADEALKLTIEEQQKEIDKLKTELSKLTKGGKGKPTTKKRKFTKKGLQEKLQKARSLASASSSPQRSNPSMSAKLRDAFGYAAGLAVEEGFTKFKDFYAFIRENFTQDEVGLDDIVEGYVNASEFAIEEGFDKKNFETREQVDTYLTEVENLEKQIADKQRQLDIKKNIVRLGQFLSERLPVQKDNTPREQKIIQLALELDEATGTETYSKVVAEYFGIVAEDLKQAKLERDIAKLEKSLEDAPKKPQAPKTPREQRLREEAARLDAEQGTTEFTKKVDEYFKQQAAKKEAEDLVKASENLAKKLAAKPKVANKPTETANEKLLRAAQELDAKLGTNTHVKAVQDFINKKEAQAKIASFGRLLSETTNDSKDRKKKEDVVKERAAELDKQFGTNIYTKQAEVYLEGKKMDKMASPAKVLESIEKGLIALGYGKEVERFSKKTGKKEKKTVVDWSQIVKGEKNPQKAWAKVEAEIQKILSPQEYMVQAPLLRDLFFANVNDRKVKAVQAEINKIARKGLPLNRAKRKTKAEKLVEMYNTGALSNKKVRQAIAEDLGIVEFTPEEEKYLNDLIEQIDKAQQGFEKEILEEELYNFFDSKKKGYVMRNVFESSRGRLLTGLISIGKNLTGVYTAASKIVYDYITANVQSLAKGGTDAQIFRVTKKAQVMAATLAADIWWNGGVDMGSAFSETTGTKEGTPRIRYIEWRKNTPLYEATGFAKISIMQPITWANRQLNTLEKGAGRTLQSVDSYNAVNVQETSAYVYIKARLKKAHPEWSNKTLLEKTWEVMYGKTLEEARSQAEQEYSDRGIILTDSVSDRIRFNRRVYEIIQQARGEAVVKAGQLAANRYTFKAPDAGVGYGVFLGLMGLKKAFNAPFNLAAQSLSKTNPKAADRVRRAGNVFSEIVFTQTLPFIKGVTNILEKRLELFPPYGVAKGIAYTVAAKLNQDNPNSSIDYIRAGEYYYRAAVGGLMIMLFKYLADDDEEGFEKIYGTGTPDWRDNATESKVTMQNRIVINGRPYPMQAFGTNDLNLMMLGVVNDLGRENLKLSKLDQEKKDAVWLEAGARMTESILRDEYLKGVMNMYKGITQPSDTYWNRTLAEYITRSVIPATGFVRQTFDMATKEQLKPVTFSEHLMKQSGLVGGWLLDRKAYDILGRTYDNGSLYGNSTGSFMEMGSKAPEVPAIDKFLFEYKPIVATKNSENETLDLMDVMGGIRSMDNVEFYDYDKTKNTYFGQLLEAYYKSQPTDKEYKGKMPEASSQSYDKLFKEAVAELKSEGTNVDLQFESNVELVEERMIEIVEEKAMAKEISKVIGELSTLAYRASFEKFLTEKNLFVPFSVRGAKEQFEEKLQSFK